MSELMTELKQLRLHGMALAWAQLIEQGGGVGGADGHGHGGALDASRWLMEHLVQVASVDRATHSVSHRMNSAKFPAHCDLAGFDFEASPVGRKLIHQLADVAFTERSAQRRAGGRIRQDACGDGHRRGAHHPTRQTGTVLFAGGSGECTRTGEETRQGGAHRAQPAAHGRGHPR